MSYRIEFAPSAARAFKKLPDAIQDRLIPKIDALAADPKPRGVEKLSGEENRYRIRVGEYRVVYAISDASRLVTVALIGHRRDVYR